MFLCLYGVWMMTMYIPLYAFAWFLPRYSVFGWWWCVPMFIFGRLVVDLWLGWMHLWIVIHHFLGLFCSPFLRVRASRISHTFAYAVHTRGRRGTLLFDRHSVYNIAGCSWLFDLITWLHFYRSSLSLANALIVVIGLCGYYRWSPDLTIPTSPHCAPDPPRRSPDWVRSGVCFRSPELERAAWARFRVMDRGQSRKDAPAIKVWRSTWSCGNPASHCFSPSMVCWHLLICTALSNISASSSRQPSSRHHVCRCKQGCGWVRYPNRHPQANWFFLWSI